MSKFLPGKKNPKTGPPEIIPTEPATPATGWKSEADKPLDSPTNPFMERIATAMLDTGAASSKGKEKEAEENPDEPDDSEDLISKMKDLFTGTAKKPKIEAPKAFSGERDDWPMFLVKAGLYFKHYKEYYDESITGETEKCVQFLQWLEGESTKTWAFSILSTVGSRKESDLLHDFKALTEEATRLWGPINTKEEAQKKLHEAYQAQTVTEYYAQFMRWANLTDYNEAAQVAAFYKGLKPAIKDLMVNIDRPQNLPDMLKQALRYESHILARNQERRTEGGYRNKPTESRRRGIRAAKLTQEERTSRIKEGRCFICNEKGHIARNCPEKKPLAIKKAKPAKEPKAEEEKDDLEEDDGQDF